jgi:hypothetical protein
MLAGLVKPYSRPRSRLSFSTVCANERVGRVNAILHFYRLTNVVVHHENVPTQRLQGRAADVICHHDLSCL